MAEIPVTESSQSEPGRVEFDFVPGSEEWMGDMPLAPGDDFLFAFDETSISGRVAVWEDLGDGWVHLVIEVPQSQRDEVVLFAEFGRREGAKVRWG